MTLDPNRFGQRGDVRDDVHDGPWYWNLLQRVFGKGSRPSHHGDDDADRGRDEDDPNRDAREQWRRTFQIPRDRKGRYEIFRQMDEFDIVSSTFDIYAEEVTQQDYDRGVSVWVESDDSRMIASGNACLENIMIEDRIFPLTRGAALMGDGVRRLVYQTGKGVLGWKYVDPSVWERVEDRYDRLIGFKEDRQKFRGKRDYPISWPWDYVHFRMLGKDEDTVYGSSMAAPLFRPWRGLSISEDSVLMYRVARAPDRNIIFVGVGDMEEHDAVTHLKKWMSRFKKPEMVDPASGKYHTTYNPLSPVEDIVMPVRSDDQGSRVENLNGSANFGEIADVEYWLAKYCGAARIPKAYLGYDDGGSNDAKSQLMQLDVRFARTLKRIRRMLVYGLRNTLDIHYTLCNPDPDSDKFNIDRVKYTVQMSPISYLDEWQRVELLQMRMTLIESMGGLSQTLGINAHAWTLYVLSNYAKLPDETILRMVARAAESPDQTGAAPFGPSPAAAGGSPFGESDGPGGGNGTSRRKLRTLAEERFGKPDRAQWAAGFSTISESEARRIAEVIHSTPKLRKVLGDVAFLHEDDAVDYGARQTDPSMLPPRVYREGKTLLLSDDLSNVHEADVLREHVADLTLGA